MLLFVGVSIGWGVMFMTDTSAVWKVMVLLVIHGLAGVLWIPASQVLIHRIVTLEELPSAVRIFVTGRYLGFLVGPIVGDALLQIFGASIGICINALIYVPLFAWLLKVPARAQSASGRPQAQGLSGFADIWSTMKVVANNRILSSMTLLVGASAFFIGNAYQAQMPGFTVDLGHARANFSYGVLLGADAAGGLAAGLILEGRGLLPPRARTAFILAMIWCCALFGFARSNTYAVSITLLFVAGFVELAFNAMAQSLVQLNAPGEIRGRVLGVYSMFAMGLRTFSGLSVGLLGSLINIHNSLSYSAAALFLLYVAIFAIRYVGRRDNARGLA
jgi:MFS family permease